MYCKKKKEKKEEKYNCFDNNHISSSQNLCIRFREREKRKKERKERKKREREFVYYSFTIFL